jgi:hypothetical protein
LERDNRGAGRRGEPTPTQAGRQEQTPQQRGEGIRGVPPPELAKPQQESGERQPQPSVLDILERRAQLHEDWVRVRFGHDHKHSRRELLAFYKEKRENVRALGDEAASLYARWPEREKLIVDLYTTSVDWHIGISIEKTRQFIARVVPLSEEQLAEELRKARETAERKAVISEKRSETRQRQRSLLPEERKRLRNERQREYARRTRQINEVFPPPANE